MEMSVLCSGPSPPLKLHCSGCTGVKRLTERSRLGLRINRCIDRKVFFIGEARTFYKQIGSLWLPSTPKRSTCGRTVLCAQVSTAVRKLGGKAKRPTMIIDAITVEKGKYAYELESAINTLSSISPRGSISRSMEFYKNKLTLQDFALIFREFAQRGDWHRSLRLFKYMQRQSWCKPTEHIYTIVIGILGREGLLDKCIEVFEDMPNNDVKWNVYAFTALINAYGRNGQYETSLSLLARMKKEKVTPNVITYNTVINACAKGGLDWEGLLGLFAQMRHEGIQPDIITYNTLLSACNSRGLVDEAGKVFKTMNEAGVVPDSLTYSSLVATHNRVGQLEKVSDLFKEMELAGNVPDVGAYNFVIEAYSRDRNVQEGTAVFRQMQDAGCAPNVVTFSTLLEAYGKQGSYEKVREFFEDMKRSGTEPNVRTYNTLIEVFGQGGYCIEAFNLFHDMSERGVEPDMATYTRLLFACDKGCLAKEAAEIYRHMLQQNLKPTAQIFTRLISIYGKAAKYEDARVAFDSMAEVDCKPDRETYNALLEAYSRGGLLKEARSTFWSMHKAGFSANVWTFNSLIEVYSKAGLFGDAAQFFQDMKKAKHTPNQETHEALLRAYCMAGLYDESLAQFIEMKEGGVIPKVSAYCLMLSISARRNRWKNVDKLLDEMQSPKMTNLHTVVASLLKGYYDDEYNWKLVENAFDSLKLEDIGTTMAFYNALLEVLWRFGHKARAARVHEEMRKRDIFPEAFRRSPLVSYADLHRMSVGAALTTLSVWLDSLRIAVTCEENIPHIVSIVTMSWDSSESSNLRNMPISRVVNSFLSMLGSPFQFAPWNKGRLVCKGAALKKWLLDSSVLDSLLNNASVSPLATGRSIVECTSDEAPKKEPILISV
ncbi:hypothetical protein O6H91_21G024400 [Diphasiastrum complanatum]|uniref:Uncharacterized protein n=1 Tax=Diphasiastrum complanatum TaxID=34168 RepID=A0ACC2AKG6_DIPCM|nr:hypothetical protein O6H91_21G024400 [Diphasiastrum complanatum]